MAEASEELSRDTAAQLEKALDEKHKGLVAKAISIVPMPNSSSKELVIVKFKREEPADG